MYICAQFPLVDMRPLLEQDSGCLGRPSWPNTKHGEFIRSTGKVELVTGRDLAVWQAEGACSALRAIRQRPDFTTDLRVRNYATGRRQRLPVNRTSRRLYADGRLQYRLELSYATQALRAQQGIGPEFQASDLIEAMVALPLNMPRPDEAGRRQEVPLMRAAPVIARHVQRATTQHGHAQLGRAAGAPHIEDGTPQLYIECDTSEAHIYLGDMNQVDAGAGPGIRLWHQTYSMNGHLVKIWLALVNRHQADPARLRHLRIHLTRIHSQFETIAILNRWLLARERDRDSRLALDGARLGSYVNAASGLLLKHTNYDQNTHRILKAAYAARELIEPGQRAALMDLLEDLRARCGRRLSRLEQLAGNRRAVYINNYFEEIGAISMQQDDHSINVTGGIHVGGDVQNSPMLNTAPITDAFHYSPIGSDDVVKSALHDLSGVMTELAGRLSAQDHADLNQQFEEFKTLLAQTHPTPSKIRQLGQQFITAMQAAGAGMTAVKLVQLILERLPG